jgi:cell division protein FtsI/penicillin-binding protein 2
VLLSQLDCEKHVRDRHVDVPMNMISTSNTVSEEQQDQLKQKQLPNLTKEQSWVRMYRVLFPHDANVPSPCEWSD